MDYKEMVYDFMNGQLTDTGTLKIGDIFVENEFADGKECNELYEKVYEAKRRICDRLKADEDADVEIIVGNMFAIARILSMKMYDYGAAAAKHGYVSQDSTCH